MGKQLEVRNIYSRKRSTSHVKKDINGHRKEEDHVKSRQEEIGNAQSASRQNMACSIVSKPMKGKRDTYGISIGRHGHTQ